METAKASFKKYVFVCENKREEGACCAENGAELRELLKKTVKERGLASFIRVSRSGCLDVCADGPNVLLMPDQVWFKRVSADDVPEIVRRASEGI